jgi:hypothetical protein
MSPFIVTTTRPHSRDEVLALRERGEHGPIANPRVLSQLAVATLEERIVFDANEWRNAGYDQPGGNERFWHHALILETHAERAGSGAHREKLATLLFLHDGRESRGHLLNAMNSIEAEARVISESGGAVVPLPNGTTIQVEPVRRFDLWRELPTIVKARYGSWAKMRDAELVTAWNAARCQQAHLTNPRRRATM